MKKPDILNGEAKEFIDCYTDAMRQSQTREDFVDIYAIYSRFYRQRFKPEMVTEYFEEWERTLYSFVKTSSGQIRMLDNTSYQIIPNDVQLPAVTFPMPTTLSQFISNCIQVKIKLIWKEKQNAKD